MGRSEPGEFHELTLVRLAHAIELCEADHAAGTPDVWLESLEVDAAAFVAHTTAEASATLAMLTTALMRGDAHEIIATLGAAIANAFHEGFHFRSLVDVEGDAGELPATLDFDWPVLPESAGPDGGAS